MLLDVMIAVRLPVLTGRVENVITSTRAVADVTVPIAPLLNTTVLLIVDGLKAKPLIVMVLEVRDKLAVLEVTTGTTVATWNAVVVAARLS